MRTDRTVLINFIALVSLAASLGGCAGANPRSEEEGFPGDPVAAIAFKIRQSRDKPELAPERQLVVDHARESKEIVLGMDREDVISMWGEPREIFTAGHPGEGNEKWVYFDGLSSRWSVSDARVLYFENGRVAGWDKLKAQ